MVLMETHLVFTVPFLRRLGRSLDYMAYAIDLFSFLSIASEPLFMLAKFSKEIKGSKKENLLLDLLKSDA